MFHDRWLYDLPSFDDTLFQRTDLEWIRHSYLMTLLFAWDENYYDRFKGRYGFDRVPGCAHDESPRPVRRLHDLADLAPARRRSSGTSSICTAICRAACRNCDARPNTCTRTGGKYFISYNPWDESTRKEEHVKGMEDLSRRTDADGVVLDTWGESSREFQAAADRVKPGMILYSEGMAVPKDMPGIVAGRVHDALFMPPPLNMNKVIKPDFAIFRVMQVRKAASTARPRSASSTATGPSSM